jgi:hypothetical protein
MQRDSSEICWSSAQKRGTSPDALSMEGPPTFQDEMDRDWQRLTATVLHSQDHGGASLECWMGRDVRRAMSNRIRSPKFAVKVDFACCYPMFVLSFARMDSSCSKFPFSSPPVHAGCSPCRMATSGFEHQGIRVQWPVPSGEYSNKYTTTPYCNHVVWLIPIYISVILTRGVRNIQAGVQNHQVQEIGHSTSFNSQLQWNHHLIPWFPSQYFP